MLTNFWQLHYSYFKQNCRHSRIPVWSESFPHQVFSGAPEPAAHPQLIGVIFLQKRTMDFSDTDSKVLVAISQSHLLQEIFKKSRLLWNDFRVLQEFHWCLLPWQNSDWRSYLRPLFYFDAFYLLYFYCSFTLGWYL